MSEPKAVRIEVALRRVTNGEGTMRVPVEATDPDIVLADCAKEITALRECANALLHQIDKSAD